MHDSQPAPSPSTTMLEAEYARMAAVETTHWWYTSLHQDVLDMIQGAFGNDRGIRILDAGCGTGGLLRFLRRHGYEHCLGLDLSGIAVNFCRQQGLDVVQGSIADAGLLRQAGKANVIVSMDVICSLPDDQQRMDFLRNAHDQLHDGGLLIVQTPAFPCLGGIHDLAVGVNKRFTGDGMRSLLVQAGIDDYRLRYRLVLLTPLVFLVRGLQRLRMKFGGAARIESDVKLPPSAFNSLLYRLQRMEDRWLGLRPFGTSLQILVRKTGGSHEVRS